MKYNISIVPNGVAVDRITARELRSISLNLALIALAIAAGSTIYLIVINFETESDVAFIVAGFGTLLGGGCMIHAMFAGLLLRSLPEQVLFNNERSMVETRHQASGVKKIEIPYSHIRTIDSRMESHWDSNSKKHTHRYAVTLYLQDGSSWDLMEASIMEMSYASDFADKIKSNISLGKTNIADVVQPKLDSPRLSVVHRGDETQIRWRNGSPANTSRRIAIPLVIIVVSSIMSLMGEGDEWFAFFDSLGSSINSFGDLAKLPDLMGGLVFSAGIVLICVIVLLVQVILILRYRLKENNIIVNKSQITSGESDLSIPLRSAGAASLTYHIGSRAVAVEILRQTPSPEKSATTAFEGDLNFKTAMNWMGRSFKEGVKQAVKETFSSNDEPSNTLAEFSFDRFSPLDVYVVKESIRQKLGTPS